MPNPQLAQIRQRLAARPPHHHWEGVNHDCPTETVSKPDDSNGMSRRVDDIAQQVGVIGLALAGLREDRLDGIELLTSRIKRDLEAVADELHSCS